MFPNKSNRFKHFQRSTKLACVGSGDAVLACPGTIVRTVPAVAAAGTAKRHERDVPAPSASMCLKTRCAPSRSTATSPRRRPVREALEGSAVHEVFGAVGGWPLRNNTVSNVSCLAKRLNPEIRRSRVPQVRHRCGSGALSPRRLLPNHYSECSHRGWHLHLTGSTWTVIHSLCSSDSAWNIPSGLSVWWTCGRRGKTAP